jgi:hypothetical protein
MRQQRRWMPSESCLKVSRYLEATVDHEYWFRLRNLSGQGRSTSSSRTDVGEVPPPNPFTLSPSKGRPTHLSRSLSVRPFDALKAGAGQRLPLKSCLKASCHLDVPTHRDLGFVGTSRTTPTSRPPCQFAQISASPSICLSCTIGALSCRSPHLWHDRLGIGDRYCM